MSRTAPRADPVQSLEREARAQRSHQDASEVMKLTLENPSVLVSGFSFPQLSPGVMSLFVLLVSWGAAIAIGCRFVSFYPIAISNRLQDGSRRRSKLTSLCKPGGRRQTGNGDKCEKGNGKAVRHRNFPRWVCVR